MLQEFELPFYPEKFAVPPEKFGGRKDLCSIFKAQISPSENRRKDFVWVIEGHPSFGKSSFAKWCEYEVETNNQNGEVILCLISLKDDIDTYFHSLQASGEDMQLLVHKQALLNRILEASYKSLKSYDRKNIFKIRWYKYKTARMWYKFCKTFKGTSFKGIKLPFSTKNIKNVTNLMENLGKLIACAKKRVDSIVIIFDDVDSFKFTLKLCFQLARELKETLLKWPHVFPNTLCILLPFPGWDLSLSETGLLRAVDERKGLGPFTRTETFEYITEQCKKTKFRPDLETFIPAIYAMSGGIPYLIQTVGVCACNNCAERDRKNLVLNFEDVFHAASEDLVNKAVETTIRDGFGFILEKYIQNSYDKEVLPWFYKAWPTDFSNELAYETKVINGLTYEAWKSGVLHSFGKKNSYKESFEKLWQAFIKKGIILQSKKNTGEYYFIADIIRKYFYKVS